MTNQILGDFYQVERQIAKKAGRKTLLCRDLRSKDLVVVKLVSFNSDFEWDDIKLFEREAETLKSLAHPAIPQYLDYFELESDRIKSFALVQTYIPAKSLQEHLQAGRSFSEGEVQELAKALLEILIYLHDRKPAVIHRDLKPSNVLLGDRTGNSIGQVYLVDFGSVQTLAAKEDGTITIVGTYGYMPPEQFGGRTVPASDLYSLGATLICVLTGTHPADLPQKDGCIQFIQQVNISRNFELWLDRTIQPSLDRRFASASQALQELENPLLLKTIVSSCKDKLLVVEKPIGSRITLTKSINSLKIIISPVRFNPQRLFSIIFAIFYNGLLFWLCFLLIPMPFNILLTIFLWSFWRIGILWMLRISYNLWGQVQISLDSYQFSLTSNFLFRDGIAFWEKTAAITKVVYVKQFYEIDSKGSSKCSPQIDIWAGNGSARTKYSIRQDKYIKLSASELEWIAKELSQWLGIPIDYE
jgi:serine/threonine protein kinase